MGKKRVINTKFWSDSFVVKLSVIEKYLFLYFLTNEHTELCGIYELPMVVIVRETGCSEKEINDAINSMHEKIIMINGWVYVKNFKKNQSTNPNMEKGAERSLSNVPTEVLEKIKLVDEGFKSLSNTSECFKRLQKTSENLNSNSNEKNKKVFLPPKYEEVESYCYEKGLNINPKHFVDYYEARGWMLGKNKIKDWKACIRTWVSRQNQTQNERKERIL